MSDEHRDDLQAKLSDFFQQTSKMILQLGDTVRDQAAKSRELIEDKMKERELNQHFKNLGREVFRLVSAGRLTLPSEFDTRLDDIRALVKELSGEKHPETAQTAAPEAPTEPAADAPHDDEP